MILVDTSVWVDFFRNAKNEHVFFLEESILNNKDICICGVILAEILQGIRNNTQYRKTKSYMQNLIFLPMDSNTFVKSAEIYRFLRQQGITIRKSIDCMIAAVAVENKIPLLHNDRDFESIKLFSELKTVL